MFKLISTVKEWKPTFSQFRLVCSLILFKKMAGLKFFQTNANQIPPLLQPTAFDSVGYNRLAQFFGLSYSPRAKIIFGFNSMQRSLFRSLSEFFWLVSPKYIMKWNNHFPTKPIYCKAALIFGGVNW